MHTNEHLPRGGYWILFPDEYRQTEMQSIATWLKSGYSGTVIGGSGSGKSNLCGFMYSKPNLLVQQMDTNESDYLFCYFDVNSLPGITTEYFYGKMLQILYESISRIEPNLLDDLAKLKPPAGMPSDVLTMSHALDQIHKLVIRRTGRTIIWLIDRFDEACRQLDVGALNNLRWLRDQARFADADQFRSKLAYVVFSRRPLERLRDRSEITDFVEILEDHTTWVGPMSVADTQWNVHQIAQRTKTEMKPAVAAFISNLSGGLTSFTKMITESYVSGKLDMTMTDNEWIATILNLPACQRICQEILDELEVDERMVLEDIAAGDTILNAQNPTVIYLQNLGYLTQDAQGNYAIVSPVLLHFVAQCHSVDDHTFGIEPDSGTIQLNGRSVAEKFTALEATMLGYLIKNERLLCKREDLEDVLWPDDYGENMGNRQQGLATLVKQLRNKIRNLTHNEQEYIVTVRGQGYRFEQEESVAVQKN